MKIREIYNGNAADISRVYISAAHKMYGCVDASLKKTNDGIKVTSLWVGDRVGQHNKSEKDYINITIQDVYTALMNTDVEVIKSDIEDEEIGYVFADDNLNGCAVCSLAYWTDNEMIALISVNDLECNSFRKVIDALVDDFEELKEIRAFVNGEINYN